MRFTFQELKNPTTTDLIFKYDNEQYTVPAGKSEMFPDFVAQLGAKRLAEREWKKPLDTTGLDNLIKSYLGQSKTENPIQPVKPTLAQEIAEEKAKLNVKTEPQEREFADLDKIGGKGEATLEESLRQRLEGLDKRSKEAIAIKEQLEKMK